MHVRAVVLSHRPSRFIYTVQPGQSFAARCGQLAAIVFDDVATVLVGPNVIRRWLVTFRYLVRRSGDTRLLLSSRRGVGGRSGRHIGFWWVWFWRVCTAFVGQVLELRGLMREQELRVVNRNRKVQIFAAFEIQGIDPDNLAAHVEQRPAATAGGDRRSGLQEFTALFF